jgi:hydroxyacylglutathione hydrolase
MQVTEHFHALRIPFKIPIAPGKLTERVVYSFIIFGDEITLIDSGVSGAETIIFDYIEKNGRDPHDISMLILSHSHPDHLGSAKAIKKATGCMVLAHPGEKQWIEDTEMQYKERPVPGFHSLVGGPVAIDRLLSDGDIWHLAKDIDCKVIHTPGHSRGSISLFCEGERIIFSGDVIPLPNDLPIYENIVDCVASIGKLRQYENVHTLLSSWETPIHGYKEIDSRIEDGLSYLRRIHENVLKAKSGGKQDLMELCQYVVHALGLPPFAANPLVAKAFASSLEAVNQTLFET